MALGEMMGGGMSPLENRRSVIEEAGAEEQAGDPQEMLGEAIDRLGSYIENPDEITPETLTELMAMLQGVQAALGGGPALGGGLGG